VGKWPEGISDLRRDALRKLARQLILASKRFWPKWLRNGKGSLRRRRAKVGNGTFEVPRKTLATRACLSFRNRVSEDELAKQLLQVLPGIVDKLTPNGRLPTMAELSQKS
jgi:hypothetical protein